MNKLEISTVFDNEQLSKEPSYYQTSCNAYKKKCLTHSSPLRSLLCRGSHSTYAKQSFYNQFLIAFTFTCVMTLRFYETYKISTYDYVSRSVAVKP